MDSMARRAPKWADSGEFWTQRCSSPAWRLTS